MIFSTFNEFKKNSTKKNFSQIYAIKNKPKLQTIEKIIELVSLNKDSFIFESVEKVKIRGRYTIFGFNPDLVIETNNNRIIQSINNKKKIIKKIPYDYLNKLINNFRFNTSKKLPLMSAMLAGYFGYDIIRLKEKIPNKCKNDLKIPDVKLIRPQLIVIHDNEKNKIFFIQNIYGLKKIKNLKKLYLLKCEQINKFVAKINNIYSPIEYLKKNKKKTIIKSNISKNTFLKYRVLCLPHSLLEQRIAASFANDQVSPLNNDNRNKECSVTGIFKGLALLVSLELIYKRKRFQ